MKTSEFYYDLPEELIAQEPLPERSQSRMMVLHRDSAQIEHRCIADLPEYLSSGDAVVVNNTMVIPARVFGVRKDTGGKVELLLVEELRSAIQDVVNNHYKCEWLCLCRMGSHPVTGMKFILATGQIVAEVLDVGESGRITVSLDSVHPLRDVLDEVGVPPVPPYIKRAGKDDARVLVDVDRYQTIYAREWGAVAAPTAGLHFSAELFDKIDAIGVSRVAVTLHVGPGTFRPVKTELVAAHAMEAEQYDVSVGCSDVVNKVHSKGGRILAVGSTTVRTLETVADDDGCVHAGSGKTAIYIHEPYQFRAIDMMLTNFHLPMSTLIMMVSAFGGRDLVFRAYEEAVKLQYRFYSYGDCMLIL